MEIETVMWNWKSFLLTWGLKRISGSFDAVIIVEFAFLRYVDLLGESNI